MLSSIQRLSHTDTHTTPPRLQHLARRPGTRGFGLGPLLAGAIATFALAACQSNDTGRCCTVTAGRENEVQIPQPERGPDGEPRDIVGVHPAFNCEELACVSFQGSQAYCTRQCEFADNCPEGFACEPILQSSAGPDASITPKDKFCVKADHMCTQ